MNIAELERQYDKACGALWKAEEAIRAAELAKIRAQRLWHTGKINCDELYLKLCDARGQENDNGC